MRAEAQRKAIASACGYKVIDVPFIPAQVNCHAPKTVFTAAAQSAWQSIYKSGARPLPDYLSDLNAIAAAEVAALTSDKDRRAFERILIRVIAERDQASEMSVEMYDFDFLHATAAQRAEAFLRTLGLWKEEA